MKKILVIVLGLFLIFALIYMLIIKTRSSTTPPSSFNGKPCKIGGCSGQVCSDEEVITTCEFREEYACYKNAQCERQKYGKCGWTQTKELKQCLQEKRSSQNDIPQ